MGKEEERPGEVVEPSVILQQVDDWSADLSDDPRVIDKAHDVLEARLAELGYVGMVHRAQEKALKAGPFLCRGYSDLLREFIEAFLDELGKELYGDLFPKNRLTIDFGLVKGACCFGSENWHRCTRAESFAEIDGHRSRWEIPIEFEHEGKAYRVNIPLSFEFKWACPRPDAGS